MPLAPGLPIIMSTTAFVFPGQGSQRPGMGAAFYEAWPEMRAQFDALDDALDADLHRLCFEGTADELRRPRNTQPAVLAVSYATYAGFLDRTGDHPDFVTGHSLGHFTALGAAGMVDSETLVGLVRARGECMEAAAERDGPGTMLAVLLADPETVTEACRGRDDVGVALYNGPHQTVVSGTEGGVAAVREAVEDETRARFRELDVGAAFHSPVMASAVEPVRELMATASFSSASIPVVSDVRGEPYTEPATAREDLGAQVTSPVDWVGVVETLSARGVDRYVEFPPAGTLTGLIERIQPEAECVALESPADAREVAT